MTAGHTAQHETLCGPWDKFPTGKVTVCTQNTHPHTHILKRNNKETKKKTTVQNAAILTPDSWNDYLALILQNSVHMKQLLNSQQSLICQLTWNKVHIHILDDLQTLPSILIEAEDIIYTCT